MNIENDIFKRSIINYNKLLKYGFKKNNKRYTFEKVFMNNNFKAVIYIENDIIYSKVIDLEMNEEYLAIKNKNRGEYVNSVRKEYENVLLDIKNNCFDSKYYIFDQTNRINNYIKDKYNDNPEFLWDSSPGCGVYRKKTSNKWYGIIMNINYSKIDNKNGEIEIINVKLNRDRIIELLHENGFYPAYHMNKKDWISIILNDTLEDKIVTDLIDESYNTVK